MKKQEDIIENGKITCKKKNDIEDEDLASKKNDDWWRLEKFQIGRKNFS